jgi:hypothetical protein
MGIQLLSVKQFLDFGKQKPMTKDEFLNEYYKDLDGDGCMGWKYNGKETTSYEEAVEWYNERNIIK